MRDDIIDKIIAVEGGHSNNPSDTGGETKYGVTLNVARANGYTGAMIDLPIETARAIYRAKYWDSVRGDDLLEIDPKLAAEVVDTGINMGTFTAGTFLQTALVALGYDLKIDGQIGTKTIHSTQHFASVRDVHTLTRALDCLQGARYIELAISREKNKTFVYGWLKNRTGEHK